MRTRKKGYRVVQARGRRMKIILWLWMRSRSTNGFYDGRQYQPRPQKPRPVNAPAHPTTLSESCACVRTLVVSPRLLKWRNQEDLTRFRAAVDFDMIGAANPFAPLLGKRAQIRPINRRGELNQMTWSAIESVYDGLGLNPNEIEQTAASIDGLVDARNDAAHRGVLPNTTAKIVERQVRQHVAIVENVLTDLALQLFTYFNNRLHRRQTRPGCVRKG